MNGLDATYETTTVDISQISPATWVVIIAIAIVNIVALWKLFVKAGKPGWHSIIPFLDLYDLVEMSGYNGWLFLLFCLPIANIVMTILVCFGLAKKFGKSGLFGLGLLLLNSIFIWILAFGSAKYEG